MDALQVTFSLNTRLHRRSKTFLGRFYLLLIYTMAAYVVVDQLADTIIVLLFLLLLTLLFYREWQQHFSAAGSHVKGIRYQQKNWSVLLNEEWQPVNELKYYYQMPWLIALRAAGYPHGQPRIIIIWRDSVSAQEWRLLRIYLSL